MTNTLHRRGTPNSLKNDYVIFCTMAKGINSEGSGPKIQEFIRLCLKYNPVNMGDGHMGNILQEDVGVQKFLADRGDGEGAGAVFTDLDTLQSVIEELIRADLGISINVSGLLDEVRGCCRKAGVERHSVEHSLGIWGAKDRLPEREILEVNTLCGHGLVSFNLVQALLKEIRRGKKTHAEASEILAGPCVCGVVNTTRTRELLKALI